jgi:hypothetical protein
MGSEVAALQNRTDQFRSIRMSKLISLIGLLFCAQAFAGTGFVVTEDVGQQALASLIQNSAKVKVTGDIPKNETIGSALAAYIAGPRLDDGVVHSKNVCAAVVNATLLDCTLSFDNGIMEETINYELNMKYDVKTDKITVYGLAKREVEITHGPL